MAGWEGAGGMPIHVRDSRGGNWFWLHNAILDTYGPKLGPYGIAVYCCLCRHAGQEQHTWVGQKELAEEIGGSRAQVHRELTKLRELGLLHVEERREAHGQASNVYTLLAVAAAERPHVSVIGGHVTPRGAGSQADTTPAQGDMPINKTQLTRPMEQDGLTDLDELWKTALADLREQVTPSNFARWLVRARLLERSDGTAVVAAPDALTAKQLAGRLDALVRRALSDACGEPVAVAYVVAEAGIVAAPQRA